MDRSKLGKEMAQKLIKHNLDVDAYLADGGTLMDLGIIDNFGNIPPEDIKWKRVRRIISFFQRAHRRFYDKSSRPVGKRPTEKQLQAIWNEPETPIDPEFLDQPQCLWYFPSKSGTKAPYFWCARVMSKVSSLATVAAVAGLYARGRASITAPGAM